MVIVVVAVIVIVVVIGSIRWQSWRGERTNGFWYDVFVDALLVSGDVVSRGKYLAVFFDVLKRVFVFTKLRVLVSFYTQRMSLRIVECSINSRHKTFANSIEPNSTARRHGFSNRYDFSVSFRQYFHCRRQ